MKKCVMTVLFALCFFLILDLKAGAADVKDELLKDIGGEELTDSLPKSAEDILGDMSLEDMSDPDSGIKRLAEKIGESAGVIFKSTLKSGGTVLLAVMLGASVLAFSDGSENVKKCVELVTVLAVTSVSVSGISSFISIGTKAADDLNTFSKILLPTLTAAMSVSGAAAAASVKYAATCLFLDVLITVINNVAVPLIYGYVAVSAASAAFGGKTLESVSNLIKWTVTSLLTLTVLLFTVYITVTGVIGESADAAAVRVTKTAMSALPVVGGLISDAASAVLSAASSVKNVVGVFGIFAVLGVCAVPTFRLLMHYFVFKAAAALSKTIAPDGVSGLINAIAGASGMILGIVGSCGVMLFISVISALRTVT